MPVVLSKAGDRAAFGVAHGPRDGAAGSADAEISKRGKGMGVAVGVSIAVPVA